MIVDSWTKEEVYFTYAPANPDDWHPLDRERLMESRPHCNSITEAKESLAYYIKTLSAFLINPKLKDLKITRVSIVYTENTVLEVK